MSVLRVSYKIEQVKQILFEPQKVAMLPAMTPMTGLIGNIRPYVKKDLVCRIVQAVQTAMYLLFILRIVL